MGRFLKWIWDAFRKCDKILLLLCVTATVFGCVMIASATGYMNTSRLVITQIVAATLGLLLYAVVSSVELEWLFEHRTALVLFNCVLLLLLIPFGTDNGTGNKSWLDFPLLPINIQPAEICKITFILIMASVMGSHQNRRSSIPAVMHLVFHLGLLAGLNILLSNDVGVSLIFVGIFIGMTVAGGISIIWYLIAGGAVAVAAPILWTQFLDEYQRLRIEILFKPELDAAGTGPRYHTVQSLRSLTGGAMTGQGLFEGHRTSQGALYAQHTDYIFSAIGEELGYTGCALVLVLLVMIVLRCIWVGNRSTDYSRKMVCFGAASALIFQILSNVGMCIGITPVIGLTLPFISYGGSSIVTLYAMVGLVSGVYARPSAPSHERYIHPPYIVKPLQ